MYGTILSMLETRIIVFLLLECDTCNNNRGAKSKGLSDNTNTMKHMDKIKFETESINEN